MTPASFAQSVVDKNQTLQGALSLLIHEGPGKFFDEPVAVFIARVMMQEKQDAVQRTSTPSLN